MVSCKQSKSFNRILDRLQTCLLYQISEREKFCMGCVSFSSLYVETVAKTRCLSAKSRQIRKTHSFETSTKRKYFSSSEEAQEYGIIWMRGRVKIFDGYGQHIPTPTSNAPFPMQYFHQWSKGGQGASGSGGK